jgi:hypothetical protein
LYSSSKNQQETEVISRDMIKPIEFEIFNEAAKQILGIEPFSEL